MVESQRYSVEGVDFENVLEDLPLKEKKEHFQLKKELEELRRINGAKKAISSNEIKKRVAEFIFTLMEETPINEIAIQETAYIISDFMKYPFDDKLSDIIEIAGGLELPDKNLPDDRIKLWNKLKKMVKGYIK
jgi:hypothetical protein